MLSIISIVSIIIIVIVVVRGGTAATVAPTEALSDFIYQGAILVEVKPFIILTFRLLPPPDGAAVGAEQDLEH